MKIRNQITPQQLNDMRASVKWRTIPSSQAKKALENSMINVGVFDHEEIIAIGRLVGDKCFKAMLTDIIVKPAYQHHGYGKLVVKEILSQAKKNMHDNEQICIEACPTNGNRDFYIQCGFTYDPSEQDGVSIWLTK